MISVRSGQCDCLPWASEIIATRLSRLICDYIMAYLFMCKIILPRMY